MGKRRISLRAGLVTTILICWLMPVACIVTLSGLLLNSNYQKSIRQQIQSEAANALEQVRTNLADAIWDSKAVSYDGIIRSSYRTFQQDGDSASLYRTVNDYMTQNFSRESRYRAAFLYFWGEGESANAYVLCRGTTGHDLLAQVKQTAPWIVDAMQDADTDIRFYNLDGELYMARNILNSRFESYATITVLLESSVILQSMEGVQRVSSLTLTVDDCVLTRMDNGTQPGSDTEIRYTVDADGHKITLSAFPEAYDLWRDTPWLRWAVLGVALMVLPLLLVMIALFHRHVSFPMETLAEANGQIQAGQRGYQIEKTAPNAEFERLYANFNVMSTELKNQFERSYQEQRAAQKAQIKALQSQINPHFLNNTLEIISWEARLADNERVCAMIEALSTMLTAALDRDGRAQIPLSEELGYVDAYLYIIRERLGGNLRVTKEIPDEMAAQLIPRLILQPIVENAVEHDITANRGGRLTLRARREAGEIVLEVEHDGTMTDKDRENIRQLISAEYTGSGRVGLRNVYRRLKLLYGDAGGLTIEETAPGTILARLHFPAP